VACGPAAVPPLGDFLLNGQPSKVFQPRLGAVQALARLNAKDILIAYFCREAEICDPEARFGEEAVASAAARSLAAWPDNETYHLLLKLSERRRLNGLIAALAQFQTPETIPYFIRALEDDFYRSAAEEALLQQGASARAALVQAALTPAPDAALETPASLNRRRSALRLLSCLGIPAASWQVLRHLLAEPDAELVVAASRLGISHAAPADRALMARRLLKLLAATPWHLLADIEETLISLRPEAAGEVDRQLARGLKQANPGAPDPRLRALLRLQKRWDEAAAPP
jgi:hypothetical protein